MNISEVVELALKEDTLLDALVTGCIWESDRAIKQGLENKGKYETCFRFVLKQILDRWEEQHED